MSRTSCRLSTACSSRRRSQMSRFFAKVRKHALSILRTSTEQVRITGSCFRSNLQGAPTRAGGLQHPLRQPVQPHPGQRPAQQPVLRHPRWHPGRRPPDPPALHVQGGGLPAPGQDQQRPPHRRGAPGEGAVRGAEEHRDQPEPPAAAAVVFGRGTFGSWRAELVTITPASAETRVRDGRIAAAAAAAQTPLQEEARPRSPRRRPGRSSRPPRWQRRISAPAP